MKNINKTLISSWLDYSINKDSNILNYNSLEYLIRKFWFEIINKITENQSILIQLKFKDENNNYRSISYAQEITYENKDLSILIKIFKEFWSIKCEDFHSIIIKSLIFTYKIITTNKNIKFAGWNLPNTMDFTYTK
jgi:hypothetical protein